MKRGEVKQAIHFGDGNLQGNITDSSKWSKNIF